jgi:hypothetical protein
MRKIDFSSIIIEHLATLRNDRTGRRSISDLFLFYILPIVIGLYFFFFPIEVKNELLSALIAVYSVFAALLFSAQIALASLAPKLPRDSDDTTMKMKYSEDFQHTVLYLAEVNSTVSYLILLACLQLFLFAGFIFLQPPAAVEVALVVGSSMHFFLSLLMLVKRSHVAFKRAYDLQL